MISQHQFLHGKLGLDQENFSWCLSSELKVKKLPTHGNSLMIQVVPPCRHLELKQKKSFCDNTLSDSRLFPLDWSALLQQMFSGEVIYHSFGQADGHLRPLSTNLLKHTCLYSYLVFLVTCSVLTKSQIISSLEQGWFLCVLGTW